MNDNINIQVATTNPEEKAAALEQLRAVQEWSAQRPKKFLAAWKRGIKLIGKDYFIIEGDLDNATNKWQLKPNTELIERSLHVISKGQATFLAAMYSFYNDKDGQFYLEELGRPNITDISAHLEKEYLEVIADLFINYCGW